MKTKDKENKKKHKVLLNAMKLLLHLQIMENISNEIIKAYEDDKDNGKQS